jgi:hypothetical protein
MRTVFEQNNPKRRDHLRDQSVDGKIMKWILKKYAVRVETA